MRGKLVTFDKWLITGIFWNFLPCNGVDKIRKMWQLVMSSHLTLWDLSVQLSHRFQYFLKFHSLKSPSWFLAVLKRGMNIVHSNQGSHFQMKKKSNLKRLSKKKNLKNWQFIKLERHCQLFLLKLNYCRANTVGLSCLRLRSPTSWASTLTSSWF